MQGRGSFGVLLQRYRRAAGLSQEQLADQAGLSRRGISDLERGVRRAPYPATVHRLAAALGLHAAEHAMLLSELDRNLPSRGRSSMPLPFGLAGFVGRERQLAEVRSLLHTERLVTLTGVGGIGKTRLALELVAGEQVDAVFVDLAALQRGAVVPEAVATTLGVVGRPGLELIETLIEVLRRRSLLLVLDNCEHVIAATSELANALLRACPELRVLTTSREVLGLKGERVWLVPPLPIPDTGGDVSLERMADYGAICLFIERVRAFVPNFDLNATNAAVVADICRRVDGIPLALELAASRVRALGVAELAARLDDRLRLLVGTGRSEPARQRTMRSTIDWSYELLSEPERNLFAQLAVFVGGWTLRAAEAVCMVDGSPVLEPLTHLVDQSLVTVESSPDGNVRYRLLEIIRQYALERLDGTGCRDSVARRHAQYFMAVAERADPELWGPAQMDWIQRLETELGNIRAALEWSLTESGDAEVGLRTAAALWWFWPRSGHVREGRAHLNRLLARHAGPTAARGWGLRGASCVAWFSNDASVIEAFSTEALDLATEAGDLLLVAWATHGLAASALGQGQLADAERLFRRVAQMARDVGDRVLEYNALHFAGEATVGQGRLVEGEGTLQQARSLIQAHGDHCGMGHVLFSLGRLALARGELARAAALQMESLNARALIRDSLGASACLDELASVATAMGHLVHATRLLAAAEAVRAPTGGGIWPLSSADRERALASVRAGLPVTRLEAEWAIGSQLSLSGALAEARRFADLCPRD